MYTYDQGSQQWKPVDAAAINLYIYHNPSTGGRRVIGMTAAQQCVVNSSLAGDTAYSQSTATFHTWTDKQFAYGANFADQGTASQFASDMAASINAMKGEL